MNIHININMLYGSIHHQRLCFWQYFLDDGRVQFIILRRAKKVAERKKRISLANGVDEIEESSSSDDDYVSIDSCIHASMKVASMKVAHP